MITIAEPKERIDKLWGKQSVHEADTYRLMRYVLRVDHEDKVLLHNAVTGRLVVLEREEAEALETLPAAYTPVMEQLVAEHYLVPERCDEYQQVVGLRSVLRKLKDAQGTKAITKYTILPTTACNARCYYCFEQGVVPLTMTEQTADDAVQFIARHCGEKKSVFLSWFGGEPTVAARRIDRICEGLRKEDIQFESDMTTNGYLFDEEMVRRAVSIWRLKSVMICVDGTEENYNKTKAYVNAEGSPYERVMRNIGLLLEQGVHVDLRMNFDVENYRDFYGLIEEAAGRFCKNPLVRLRVHPVIGEHQDHDGMIRHGSSAWFNEKIVELNDAARKACLLQDSDILPYLRIGCQAASDSTVTISASGMLSKCPEQFGECDAIGDLKQGITNAQAVRSWKEFGDYPGCIDCVLFPWCTKMKKCSAKERCDFRTEMHRQMERILCRRYDGWKQKAKVL